MAGIAEQCECPLCMEPLEIDDISFYPCTCGYQICRFCWHRIRTDENGLCPACRKQYSEDPAEFKPLTEDELQRIKKERRQKDVQRKQKAAESRKHLANVRVVQKNLVFVVGLSQRLADPDQLKKVEYFGKFGKIHKVVINQSTSYAGAQGPSASAYVTYCRSSDALKAILNVNNVHIDGRTLKASLGTTKYCSHFLKGTQCQKVDCMYLHELGEDAASFTKEEMQMGKHQEYEQKLLHQYQTSQLSQNNNKHTRKGNSPVTVNQTENSHFPLPLIPPMAVEDAPESLNNWPVLNKQHSTEKRPSSRAYTPPSNNHTPVPATLQSSLLDKNCGKQVTPLKSCESSQSSVTPAESLTSSWSGQQLSPRSADTNPISHLTSTSNRRPLMFENTNGHSLSLFSGDGFIPRLPISLKHHAPPTSCPSDIVVNSSIPDTLDVSSNTDWQAAFGFAKTADSQDDDLGFDPLEVSAKGLADLMRKERIDINQRQQVSTAQPMWPSQQPVTAYSNIHPTVPHPSNLPPGFTMAYPPNHLVQNTTLRHSDLNVNGNRVIGMPSPATVNPAFSGHKFYPYSSHIDESQNDPFNTKNWQDGLRALLPNINISFSSQQQQPTGIHSNFPHMLPHNSDTNTGQPWLKSVPPYPETDVPVSNHRLPFVQQLSLRGAGWQLQTRNPPPGFQTMPSAHNSEPHTVTDSLL